MIRCICAMCMHRIEKCFLVDSRRVFAHRNRMVASGGLCVDIATGELGVQASHASRLENVGRVGRIEVVGTQGRMLDWEKLGGPPRREMLRRSSVEIVKTYDILRSIYIA
jgi:hypothetical protein